MHISALKKLFKHNQFVFLQQNLTVLQFYNDNRLQTDRIVTLEKL